MIKKLILILLISSLANAAIFVDPSDYATSAKTIGTGAAGFTGDAASVFDNAAAMFKCNNFGVSGFNTKIIDDAIQYSNVAFVYKSSVGIVGIGAVRLSSEVFSSSVDGYGEFVKGENVGYENSVFYLSINNSDSDNVYFGYTFKLYSSKLAGVTGQAFNMDVGLYVDDIVGSDLSIVVKNVLFKSKYNYSNEATEDMPLGVVFGVNSTVSDLDLYFQVKVDRRDNATPHKNIGIKLTPSILGSLISFYGSSKEFYVGSLTKSSFSYGVNLNLEPLTISYSSEITDYLGDNINNYISIGITL
jgi:hypothetical protein